MALSHIFFFYKKTTPAILRQPVSCCAGFESKPSGLISRLCPVVTPTSSRKKNNFFWQNVFRGHVFRCSGRNRASEKNLFGKKQIRVNVSRVASTVVASSLLLFTFCFCCGCDRFEKHTPVDLRTQARSWHC